jgi:hypothetical protein
LPNLSTRLNFAGHSHRSLQCPFPSKNSLPNGCPSSIPLTTNHSYTLIYLSHSSFFEPIMAEQNVTNISNNEQLYHAESSRDSQSVDRDCVMALARDDTTLDSSATTRECVSMEATATINGISRNTGIFTPILAPVDDDSSKKALFQPKISTFFSPYKPYLTIVGSTSFHCRASILERVFIMVLIHASSGLSLCLAGRASEMAQGSFRLGVQRVWTISNPLKANYTEKPSQTIIA